MSKNTLKKKKGSVNRPVGSSSDGNAVTNRSVLVAGEDEEFEAKDGCREAIFLEARTIQPDRRIRGEWGIEADIEQMPAREVLASLNDTSNEYNYGFSSSPGERTWAHLRDRKLYAEVKDRSWILVDNSGQ